MKRRILGNVGSTCVLMSMIILLLALSSSPAQALCAQSPFEGVWVNSAPQPVRISSVNIHFVCQDQILNGKIYPPGPPYWVSITGKSPIDGIKGSWGEVGGARKSGSNELVATFGAADSNGNYAKTEVSFRPETENYYDKNGALRSKKLLFVTAQTTKTKFDIKTGDVNNNYQTVGDKTYEVLHEFEYINIGISKKMILPP